MSEEERATLDDTSDNKLLPQGNKTGSPMVLRNRRKQTRYARNELPYKRGHTHHKKLPAKRKEVDSPPRSFMRSVYSLASSIPYLRSMMSSSESNAKNDNSTNDVIVMERVADDSDEDEEAATGSEENHHEMDVSVMEETPKLNFDDVEAVSIAIDNVPPKNYDNQKEEDFSDHASVDDSTPTRAQPLYYKGVKLTWQTTTKKQIVDFLRDLGLPHSGDKRSSLNQLKEYVRRKHGNVNEKSTIYFANTSPGSKTKAPSAQKQIFPDSLVNSPPSKRTALEEKKNQVKGMGSSKSSKDHALEQLSDVLSGRRELSPEEFQRITADLAQYVHHDKTKTLEKNTNLSTPGLDMADSVQSVKTLLDGATSVSMASSSTSASQDAVSHFRQLNLTSQSRPSHGVLPVPSQYMSAPYVPGSFSNDGRSKRGFDPYFSYEASRGSMLARMSASDTPTMDSQSTYGGLFGKRHCVSNDNTSRLGINASMTSTSFPLAPFPSSTFRKAKFTIGVPTTVPPIAGGTQRFAPSRRPRPSKLLTSLGKTTGRSANFSSRETSVVAKRILETLNEMSTPLQDARSKPTATPSFAWSKYGRMQGEEDEMRQSSHGDAAPPRASMAYRPPQPPPSNLAPSTSTSSLPFSTPSSERFNTTTSLPHYMKSVLESSNKNSPEKRRGETLDSDGPAAHKSGSSPQRKVPTAPETPAGTNARGLFTQQNVHQKQPLFSFTTPSSSAVGLASKAFTIAQKSRQHGKYGFTPPKTVARSNVSMETSSLKYLFSPPEKSRQPPIKTPKKAKATESSAPSEPNTTTLPVAASKIHTSSMSLTTPSAPFRFMPKAPEKTLVVVTQGEISKNPIATSSITMDLKSHSNNNNNPLARFMVGGAGKWKCPSCLVMNEDAWEKCPCCETKKPTSLLTDASKSTTQQSSFSFGNASAAAAAPAAKKDDGGMLPTKPTFSFSGPPPKNTESAAEKPAFSFGVPPPKGSEPSSDIKPAFSFGIAAKKDEPASNPPSFTFGVQEKKDDAFSFGLKSQASEPPVVKPAILFGSAETTTSVVPAKSSFSFGSSLEPASDAKKPEATSAFTFGASKPVGGEASKPEGSTPSFGFSMDPSTSKTKRALGDEEDTPPLAKKPAFSFGTTLSVEGPSAGKSNAISNGFSFGSTTSTNNSASMQAQDTSSEKSKPSFTFGSSAIAPEKTSATSSTFSFGASKEAAPTGAGAGAGAPAFQFGAAKPSGGAGGFSFGTSAALSTSSQSTSATAAPAFAFGSAKAEGTVGSTAPPTFSFGSSSSASTPASISLPPKASLPSGQPAFSFGAASSTNSVSSQISPPSQAPLGFGFGFNAAPSPSPTPSPPSSTNAANTTNTTTTTGGAFVFGATTPNEGPSPFTSTSLHANGAAPFGASQQKQPSQSQQSQSQQPMGGMLGFGHANASVMPGATMDTSNGMASSSTPASASSSSFGSFGAASFTQPAAPTAATPFGFTPSVASASASVPNAQSAFPFGLSQTTTSASFSAASASPFGHSAAHFSAPSHPHLSQPPPTPLGGGGGGGGGGFSMGAAPAPAKTKRRIVKARRPQRG